MPCFAVVQCMAFVFINTFYCEQSYRLLWAKQSLAVSKAIVYYGLSNR